jgi:hypothetical protein
MTAIDQALRAQTSPTKLSLAEVLEVSTHMIWRDIELMRDWLDVRTGFDPRRRAFGETGLSRIRT